MLKRKRTFQKKLELSSKFKHKQNIPDNIWADCSRMAGEGLALSVDSYKLGRLAFA